MKPSAFPWKNLLRWGGTLLSLGLFLWLLAHQDWARAWHSLQGLSAAAFFLAAGLYAASYLFNTLRWCLLLWAQNVPLPYGRALKISWAGNFVSNFLPSTIGGDGYRMAAIAPLAASKTIVFGAVALDRLVNMAAMACLIPLPLSIFGAGAFRLQLGFFAPPGAPALSSTAQDFFCRISRLSAPLAAQDFSNGLRLGMLLPAGLNRLLERAAPRVWAALRVWLTRPWALGAAFLAAWPSNLLPMAASYTLAHALGMEISYLQIIAVQTVTYFLSVLPVSVNGLGLREVAYTTLYTALGASLEQASSLALLTRLLTTLLTLPGAAWLGSSWNLRGGGE